MAHAEICPICKGTGKKKKDIMITEEICNGCSGKGWVTVQDPIIHYFPIYPYDFPVPSPVPSGTVIWY